MEKLARDLESATMNLLNKNNPGKRDRTLALRQFLRRCCITGNKKMALKFVGFLSNGIKDRNYYLKCCKLSAPFSYCWIIANPNFSKNGIKFLTKAKSDNHTASVKNIKLVVWWIGLISSRDLGKRKALSNVLVQHRRRMSHHSLESNRTHRTDKE